MNGTGPNLNTLYAKHSPSTHTLGQAGLEEMAKTYPGAFEGYTLKVRMTDTCKTLLSD